MFFETMSNEEIKRRIYKKNKKLFAEFFLTEQEIFRQTIQNIRKSILLSKCLKNTGNRCGKNGI